MSGMQKDVTKAIFSVKSDDRKALVIPPKVESQRYLPPDTKYYPAPESHPSRQISPCASYRRQLLSAFLYYSIPASNLGFAEERSWLVVLADLPAATKASETSIMALCMARVGRETHDVALIRESLSVYTRGLYEMQKALYDPQQMYRDETLGSCMALATYELIECPAANRRAYASHQDGCTKLVELRGPEAHSSGPSHQIFLAFRKQSVSKILQALDRHQPTYLATSAWLAKPWSVHPKSPIDKIFDFFAIAPDIFRQADKLAGMSPRDALNEILKLIDHCWKINASVENFYVELKSMTLGPLYWPELSREKSSLDNAEFGKVFSVAFHFLHLNMASTLMYYWSTLLMLWSGLCRLYLAISTLDLHDQDGNCDDNLDDKKAPDSGNHAYSHGFNMSRLPPLGQCSGFPSMAWNVCQSAEYCMQESMLGLGPSALSAPLAIVIDTMKEIPGYGREVSWAKEIMARITARGMRILKY